MISVGVTLVYMASVSRPREKMADDSGTVNVQVLVTMVVDAKDVSLIYRHKQFNVELYKNPKLKCLTVKIKLKFVKKVAPPPLEYSLNFRMRMLSLDQKTYGVIRGDLGPFVIFWMRARA